MKRGGSGPFSPPAATTTKKRKTDNGANRSTTNSGRIASTQEIVDDAAMAAVESFRKQLEYSKKQRKIAQLKEDREKVAAEKAHYMRAIREKDAALTEAKEMVAEMYKRAAEHKVNLQRMVDTKTKLRERIENEKIDLNKRMNVFAELKSRVRQAKETALALKRKTEDELEKANQKVDATEMEYKNSQAQHQAALEETRREWNDLNKALGDARNRSETVISDIEKARKEADETRTLIADEKVRKTEIMERLEGLEQQLECEREYSIGLEKLTSISNDFEITAAKLEAMKTELKAKEEEEAIKRQQEEEAKRQQEEEAKRRRDEAIKKQEEEAIKIEAARLEAQKAEEAKLEALMAEEARLESMKLESMRLEEANKAEAAKLDAMRAAATKLEAMKEEAAKFEAMQAEAMKTEAARLEAMKAEAAKLQAIQAEAMKMEAARLEAMKMEAAKLESMKAEAAKLEAIQAVAMKAEMAKLEAMKAETAKLEASKAEMAKLEAMRAETAKMEASKAEAMKQRANENAIVVNGDAAPAISKSPRALCLSQPQAPSKPDTPRVKKVEGRHVTFKTTPIVYEPLISQDSMSQPFPTTTKTIPFGMPAHSGSPATKPMPVIIAAIPKAIIASSSKSMGTPPSTSGRTPRSAGSKTPISSSTPMKVPNIQVAPVKTSSPKTPPHRVQPMLPPKTPRSMGPRFGRHMSDSSDVSDASFVDLPRAQPLFHRPSKKAPKSNDDEDELGIF